MWYEKRKSVIDNIPIFSHFFFYLKHKINPHLPMGEAGEDVLLYVYDLSGGMASVLGQQLLRKFLFIYLLFIVFNLNYFNITEKKLEGIWHSAIVVFGKEHFFGSNGISICQPVSISWINSKYIFYN